MKTIEVYARDYYSRNFLEVKKGDVIEFQVDPNEKWVDLIIPSNVEGYHNRFLRERKKRMKGVPCFALCGTINKNKDDHFRIGLSKKWTSPKTGNLFFFANDHENEILYLNNFGRITLKYKILNRITLNIKDHQL